MGVQPDAEQVGGNKTHLRGAQSDHANDQAVHGGEDPAFPASPANQHGRDDRQRTRQKIKSEYNRGHNNKLKTKTSTAKITLV